MARSVHEESNLTQHVFLLRKALSRHDSDQKIIQTVPGRGYRFTAPLVEPYEQAEQGVLGATKSITRATLEEEDDFATPPLVEIPTTRPVARSGKRLALIAAAILIAAAPVGWFGLVSRDRLRPSVIEAKLWMLTGISWGGRPTPTPRLPF